MNKHQFPKYRCFKCKQNCDFKKIKLNFKGKLYSEWQVRCLGCGTYGIRACKEGKK